METPYKTSNGHQRALVPLFLKKKKKKKRLRIDDISLVLQQNRL